MLKLETKQAGNIYVNMKVGHIIATLCFIDNINQKYSLYIMEGNLEKGKEDNC